ncbi:MAG: ABC transporter ATP-binding protein [Ignisphaera sp.]|nr:ABC transporter ATP-binding protein [Ignisphaera sp.]MCX8167616.1 ABC transporter ATP-binding protein [Ignisphaera sp.]MDW8086133.1 ABC transporter ATP-binding protein [Ignisphaera sp.]
MGEMLRIENATKIFRYGFLGFKFRAVDDVSMSLEDRPAIFTIAGESGSGKTTLARLILRILKPDYGRILFNGRNIYEIDSKSFYKNVQPIFQDPYASFNPMQKPIRYLRETVKNVVGIVDEREVDEHIARVVSYVGLDIATVANKHQHEFSGGELQRMAIARALLTKPKLIVADEPVSMLDASLRINIVNLFKRIKDEMGVSFIYITHDLATAYYISDYIAIMYRGSIIESGRAEKVLSEPLHPYTKALMESLPIPDPKHRRVWRQRKIAFTSSIEEAEFVIKGCKYVYRCPYAFDKCRVEMPPYIFVNESSVRCWLYFK